MRRRSHRVSESVNAIKRRQQLRAREQLLLLCSLPTHAHGSGGAVKSIHRAVPMHSPATQSIRKSAWLMSGGQWNPSCWK
jgi:hypothetical protein